MYRIEVRARAKEQIAALPQLVRRHALLAIEKLGDDPRPPGVRKLEGKDEYRVRVGDYRVIYTIEDAVLVVTVLRAQHRSTVYR